MNIKDIKNLDKEQILDLLGIETKSTLGSILGSFGWLVLGAATGAVVALLLAPKPGSELRRTVARTFKRTADDVVTTARAKMDELQAEKGS